MLKDELRRLWKTLDLHCPALFDEPLAQHTWFQVGGPADMLVFPRTTAELLQLWKLAGDYGIPKFILGGGSNLIVRDGGIRGIAVSLRRGLNKMRVEGRELTAEAGANLAGVLKLAQREGLAGLEDLAGIPGTLGGAVYGNAGASEIEIGRLTKTVKVMEETALIRELNHQEFSYRSFNLPEGSLILEANFELAHGSAEQIEKRMAENLMRRRKTQPLGEHCAGCIFKNPPGCYAGRLIDEAGLKGMAKGGAAVSTIHANFIVNKGGATAKDILQLMEQVKEAVANQKGISLEEEVVVVGED